MKKKNLSSNLLLIFQILFTLFCLIPAGLGFATLFGGAGKLFGHELTFYNIILENVLPSLLVVLGIIGLGILSYFLIDKIASKTKKTALTAAIGLFLLSFVLRMILLVVFNKSINPFSDSAAAWLMAKGDSYYFSHYRYFPAYACYAVFMRFIARFFNYSFLSVLWSNVFLNSFTTVGIYFLAQEIYQKQKVSLIAGLIYALYPVSILEAIINMPEHLCILAMVWALFLFLKAVNSEKIIYSILFAVCAGILCGISNSMKSFYPIMLVALFMFMLFFLIANKWQPKKILLAALILVSVIGMENLTMSGINHVSEKLLGTEFDYSIALPHFVYVGLNRQGEGQIGLGNISKTYNDLIESGVDKETAKEKALTVFKEDWKGHEKEIPSFFMKKLIWAFQADTYPYNYMSVGIDTSMLSQRETAVYNFLMNYGTAIMQIFYIMISLAALICSVYRLRKQDLNLQIFLMELLVFGFFCLILLSEAQSRYKVLIFPYIAVLIAPLFCGSIKSSRDK